MGETREHPITRFVDETQIPRRHPRAARTVNYHDAIFRAAAAALASRDGFGWAASHGGSVNNSYGYPADTDSVLTAATRHPDGKIRVSMWHGRLPANKVTLGGAISSAVNMAADTFTEGDAIRPLSDNRYGAERAQAARRRLRELHEARITRAGHAAEYHLPPELLLPHEQMKGSPLIFADWAEEHGYLTPHEASNLRGDTTGRSDQAARELLSHAPPHSTGLSAPDKPVPLSRVRLAAIAPPDSPGVLVRVPTAPQASAPAAPARPPVQRATGRRPAFVLPQ